MKEVLVLYVGGPYLKAKCQTLSAFLLVWFYLLVHWPNFSLSPKHSAGRTKWTRGPSVADPGLDEDSDLLWSVQLLLGQRHFDI
jgi:hypothetical protein